MNHDYSHCLDFKENCPKKCFRAELVRDLRSREDMVGVPVSWMHFKGSDECPKVKMKNMRLIDANAIEYEQIMEPMGNGMYSHANHVYEGDIDAMPTVDAIPVEWMENRECKPDEAYAIRKMLNEWAADEKAPAPAMPRANANEETVAQLRDMIRELGEERDAMEREMRYWYEQAKSYEGTILRLVTALTREEEE